MNPVEKIQNRFHGELGAYINNCAFNRSGILLTVVSRRLACLLNAARIGNSYNSFSTAIASAAGSLATAAVDIPVYSGDNSHVRAMMRQLEPIESHLRGAYIHGSLGSGEEIGYSDFDALVLLKDEVFDSSWGLSNVAARLSSLQRTMLDFDPLQHHGWFVLVESDLRYYCDAYFPVELFKHARSLLKTNGTHLDIAVRNSETENRDVFNTVAMSVINKTASYPEPMNLYQLKSLLSEFMLLPALYLQAAQGAGVFKKYSYGLAKEDFSAKEWEIMDEVSAIRSEWVNKNSYTMNVLLSLNLTARIILGRKFSSAIPSNIHSRMTRDFYRRIHALAASMHVKINGIAP